MAAHLAARDSAAITRPGFLPPAKAVATARTAQVVAFAVPRKAADPLDAIAETVVVDRERVVFSEGDLATSIHRVVDGMVRIYKLLPDGRRQIVGFLQAGDMMGLTLGASYLYTAEAVTACTLRRIPRSRLEAMIEEDPAVARRLHEMTVCELAAAQDHMLLLGRKTAAEKVATFLLMLADRAGKGGARLRLPMSRADIADHLGLTTETVSRAVTKLKTSSLIRLLEGGLVEILDRDRLAAVTESI